MDITYDQMNPYTFERKYKSFFEQLEFTNDVSDTSDMKKLKAKHGVLLSLYPQRPGSITVSKYYSTAPIKEQKAVKVFEIDCSDLHSVTVY